MLNEEEAYASMVIFLERYWQRSRSEELADLLSGLKWLAEKRTGDPAFWEEWKEVLKEIQRVAYSPNSWQRWKQENLYLHFQLPKTDI